MTRGQRGERQREAEQLHGFHPVDVVDDPHDAEGAGLDHRDGVQKRADRRGRDHRDRQPAMQRHQRGLDADAGDQQHKDGGDGQGCVSRQIAQARRAE